MKLFEKEGITIKMGENAKENWKLTLTAKPIYTWIHLSAFPSSHVIIESENPSKEVIQYAATLCHQYSKFKNLKKVKYSITNCSNIIRGDKTGEVFFKSNKKVQDLFI
tara:strand:- start:6624 stop:6947 length:324 start_codon:yes stop_codon:yes gene_type:complete